MKQADLSAKRGCSADLAGYWRGLRLFYDPRGRSSRTELFMLLLLPTLVLGLLSLIFGGLLPDNIINAASFAATLFVLAPIPAATARRFHDMGKSGWLALPVLILCVTALWDSWRNLQDEPFVRTSLWSEQPTLGFVYGLIGLMLIIILMQPAKHTNNPHGPDPRPTPKQI